MHNLWIDRKIGVLTSKYLRRKNAKYGMYDTTKVSYLNRIKTLICLYVVPHSMVRTSYV